MERRYKSNHQPMEKHPFYSKDQIAAYLNGKMSDSQTEAFENLLDNDPFFEAIVEGIRLQKVAKKMVAEDPKLLNGYENFNQERLLKNIGVYSQQFEFKIVEHKTKVKPMLSKWTWQTAAAVILLIGAGTWVYYSSQNLPANGAIIAQQPNTTLPLRIKEVKKKNDKQKVAETLLANNTKATSTPSHTTESTEKLTSQQKAKALAVIKKSPQAVISEDMQKLIAINKQEIKYWEDELTNYQNSRGHELITILSPATGSELSSKEVVFEVKYEGNSTLLLTVYESQSMTKALVVEVPLVKTKDPKKFQYLMQNLKKGTYYWKLTDEEEELFIGKFQKVK